MCPYLAVKVVKNQLERSWKDTYMNERLRLEYKALLEQIKSAAELFNDKYYETAIEIFARLVVKIVSLPQVDPIVVQYLELVRINYLEIYDAFTGAMDEEIELRKNEVFDPRELDSYNLLKKHKSLQVKLQSHGRIKLKSRKTLWHRTADELSESLRGNLQSFK